MHHIYLALLLLSQPPQPAIVGNEDIVPIGRLEFYDVEGITQDQFDKSQVLVRPRGYDTMVRVMYDRRGPDQYQPVILFRADEANALQQYDLVVAYPDTDGVVQLLEWTIKTGEAPNPPPGPDPPDPPTPPPSNVTKAILIYESEETTAEWGTMQTQIRDQGLPVTILDQDTENEDEKLLPEILEAQLAITQHGLPCLVGYSADGEAIASEGPMETVRDVAETLKKWGLE